MDLEKLSIWKAVPKSFPETDRSALETFAGVQHWTWTRVSNNSEEVGTPETMQ